MPAAFRAKAENVLSSGYVTLQGPSGEKWPIKLCKRRVYLREGWTSFFRDNNLKENDFLLFSLLKDSTIEVEVLRGGLGMTSAQLTNVAGSSSSNPPIANHSQVIVYEFLFFLFIVYNIYLQYYFIVCGCRFTHAHTQERNKRGMRKQNRTHR